jgi:alkanesulfonate monooxygenase SsuD/methylene tetrahydromethanopterin reductase-like flavin-dependent oxidoreductase (luciferase family)
VRGQRMDAALDHLISTCRSVDRLPIMVGGFSEVALRRAGSRGLGIFLPFSMHLPGLRDTISRYRELAAAAGATPGRIGMLKYAWATDGSERQREQARETIKRSAREYSGAWFPLRGRVGFEAPALLDGQLERAADTAFIGAPEQIAVQIRELKDIGVDLVVLQVTRDDVEIDHRPNLEAIAEHVVPALTAP